jgi:tetratricopeptide (TPR) repeat protein
MKKKLFVILFFIMVFTAAQAQDVLTSQKNYADRLFNNQQYFDAVTEYKRLLAFDSTYAFSYGTSYRIGECYKAGAKFDEAIKYFTNAEKIAVTDSSVFDCKTQIIRTNILRKTSDRALQLCNELEKDDRFRRRIDDVNYWRGWAYMFADDWYAAGRAFAKINYGHELRKLADQTDQDKVSVTFAKVISYILPGAGSIYSGNILSGLMSLAWNAAAGYWTINAFTSDRIFDGIAVGELVWLRFYRGSIQNAEEFATQKNIDIANKSLRYLQNEYKGLKP